MGGASLNLSPPPAGLLQHRSAYTHIYMVPTTSHISGTPSTPSFSRSSADQQERKCFHAITSNEPLCTAAALQSCHRPTGTCRGRRGNTATVKLFGISALVDSFFPAELKMRSPRNAGRPGDPDFETFGSASPLRFPLPLSNTSPPLTARLHRHKRSDPKRLVIKCRVCAFYLEAGITEPSLDHKLLPGLRPIGRRPRNSRFTTMTTVTKKTMSHKKTQNETRKRIQNSEM